MGHAIKDAYIHMLIKGCVIIILIFSSANISFLLEDNMKDYFDELVFPELDREAAQQLLETYNKVDTWIVR